MACRRDLQRLQAAGVSAGLASGDSFLLASMGCAKILSWVTRLYCTRRVVRAQWTL